MASVGGSVIALGVLYVLCALGGYFLYFLKHGFSIGRFSWKGALKEIDIPPIIGMLWMGFFTGNLLRDTMADLDTRWPPYIQNLALCVILIRSGFGLNIQTLQKMKDYVLAFSLIPTICEWQVLSVIIKYLLDLPWDLSFAAGFMLAAVSPAIVIPICLDLDQRGYGKERNIQELLIGVTSLETLTCIVMFGILSEIALSSLQGSSNWLGDPVMMATLTVPIILVGGCALGLLFGLLFKLLRRVHWAVYLLLLSVTSLTLSYTTMYYKLSGIAYIAILLWSLISIRSRSPEDIKQISWVMLMAWRVVEIFQFGLVGAAMDVVKLDSSTIGAACFAIFAGLVIKVTVNMVVSYMGPFTFKEKVHIALCRIPKATVQASLGGVILARADVVGDFVYRAMGRDILTTAAISIMITASFSIVITTLTPYLLTQTVKPGAETLLAVQGKKESV